MAMSSACLPIFRCSTKRRSRFRRSPDRKSTRLNSSHSQISYAVFCLKKKTTYHQHPPQSLPPPLLHVPHRLACCSDAPRQSLRKLMTCAVPSRCRPSTVLFVLDCRTL